MIYHIVPENVYFMITINLCLMFINESLVILDTSHIGAKVKAARTCRLFSMAFWLSMSEKLLEFIYTGHYFIIVNFDDFFQ